MASTGAPSASFSPSPEEAARKAAEWVRDRAFSDWRGGIWIVWREAAIPSEELENIERAVKAAWDRGWEAREFYEHPERRTVLS